MSEPNFDRWLGLQEDAYAEHVLMEETRAAMEATLRHWLDKDDPELAENEEDYQERVYDAATLAEMRWEESEDR